MCGGIRIHSDFNRQDIRDDVGLAHNVVCLAKSGRFLDKMNRFLHKATILFALHIGSSSHPVKGNVCAVSPTFKAITPCTIYIVYDTCLFL